MSGELFQEPICEGDIVFRDAETEEGIHTTEVLEWKKDNKGNPFLSSIGVKLLMNGAEFITATSKDYSDEELKDIIMMRSEENE